MIDTGSSSRKRGQKNVVPVLSGVRHIRINRTVSHRILLMGFTKQLFDMGNATRRISCVWMSVGAGVVLWTAAVLKMLAGPSDVWGPPVHVLICHVEVAVGGWLISGYKPRVATAVAGCGFAVFAVVNLFRVIYGETSCGCFGRLEVPPLYTFALDVLLALGLAWVAGSGQMASLTSSKVRRSCAVMGALALLLLFWPRLLATPAESAKLADLGAVSGKLVILEPDQWVGKPMTLAAFIQDGTPLLQGDWLVLLHRHDCSTCQRAIPNYAAALRSSPRSFAKLALVEAPPYAGQPAELSADIVFTSRLMEGFDWFVATPVVIYSRNGRVLHVTSGEQAVDAERVLENWTLRVSD
jgi:hypothetical protein